MSKEPYIAQSELLLKGLALSSSSYQEATNHYVEMSQGNERGGRTDQVFMAGILRTDFPEQLVPFMEKYPQIFVEELAALAGEIPAAA